MSGTLLLRAAALGAVLVLSGCGGRAASPQPASSNDMSTAFKSSVQHIVIVMQENRSFDHYFGKLNDYRVRHNLPRDVDGLPDNAVNPSRDGTQSISAFRWESVCHEAASPSWNESHLALNRTQPNEPTEALNNGFVTAAANFAFGERAAGKSFQDTDGRRAMGYLDEHHLPYYYWLATQFAISDRFFASVLSRTPPNRLYLLAATSFGYVDDPGRTFPNSTTLFHQLAAAAVSWKVYYRVVGPNGFPITTLNPFYPFTEQHREKLVPISQYFEDARNGTLPAVAFIETHEVDEHAPSNLIVGVSAAKEVIDALMASPDWPSSVLFLTWDEAGGLYDHVAPPPAPHPDGIAPVDLKAGDFKGDFDRYGFRVPLLVVSPFARKGFVSHSVADFTALMKFVQNRYGLPSLTRRDAAQPDLLEMFDFVNRPNLSPPAPPAQPPPSAYACDHDRIP